MGKCGQRLPHSWQWKNIKQIYECASSGWYESTPITCSVHTKSNLHSACFVKRQVLQETQYWPHVSPLNRYDATYAIYAIVPFSDSTNLSVLKQLRTDIAAGHSLAHLRIRIRISFAVASWSAADWTKVEGKKKNKSEMFFAHPFRCTARARVRV